ncbi:MAG: FG-GAP-like repeat-containing protein, partial [Pseudomonadota bacterium]
MFYKHTLTLVTLLAATVSSYSSASVPPNREIVGSIPAEFNVINGTANYAVPIQVAPGRGGMQPDLSLNYSSGGGNGILGVGWSLGGLSAIHRCARTIAQDGAVGSIRFNANDRYCLDGQRLIPIAGKNGGVNVTYRTEIDSYSQIKSLGGSVNNPAYWQVKTKAGQVITYGGSGGATQSFSQGKMTWSVREINDTTGQNPISYSYFIEQNKQYLDEINYAGGRVNLLYSLKPNKRKSYFMGNAIGVEKRLSRIDVFSQTQRIKHYHLNYKTVGVSKQSHLINVILCGTTTRCFPATHFSQSPVNTAATFKASSASLNLSYSDAGVIVQGDFNGDGLSDFMTAGLDSYGRIVRQNERTQIHLSKGDGSFTKRAMPLNLSYGNIRVFAQGDFNGDGLTDFLAADATSDGRIVNQNTRTRVYLSNGDGSFSGQSMPLKVNYGNIGVIAQGDYNGDGLTDFISADLDAHGRIVNPNHRTRLYLSNGDGSFSGRSLPLNLSHAHARVVAQGDFNGDGLSDFLTADSTKDQRIINQNTRTKVYLSNGDGSFSGRSISLNVNYGNIGVIAQGDYNGDSLTDFIIADLDTYGRIVNQNNRTRIYLSKGDGSFNGQSMPLNLNHNNTRIFAQGDLNGDGLSDFLLADATKDKRITNQNTVTRIYLSNGDASFSNHSLPLNTSYSNVGIIAQGDFNGDGLSDFMAADVKPDGRIINQNKRTKMYLNSGHVSDAFSITSGSETTKVSYKPLTNPSLYTKGSTAQFPVRDEIYPQYLVAQVQTNNGVGGKTTVKYQYQGLKVHTQGRGSYGYSKIIESYSDTGKKTTTTFDQRGFPYTGNVLTVVETYTNKNGKTQKINEAVNTMKATQTRPGVYQLNLQRSVQKSYELGNGNNPVTQVTSTHSNIDNYGNIGRVTVMTSSNGQTFTKITDSTYTNDTANWLLGRLRNTTVTHKSPYGPDEKRSSDFTYHSTTGLLTKERIVSTKTGLPLTTTTYTYNNYGQKTAVRVAAEGEKDRVNTTRYNHIGKPTQSCNALNQCETFTYTPHGWLASTTGPNRITTEWIYDGFGRKIREDRADGTWTTIDRHFAASGLCGQLANFAYSCTVTQTSGSKPTTTQYDALSRELRKIRQGFEKGLVYNDVQYNPLGQVSRVSRDYYQGDHLYWATSHYDALGRVIRVTEPGPHGSTNITTTDYNGLSTTVRTGPQQRAKTTHTNAIGQKVRIDEEQGTYTEYTYNSDGNLLSTRIAGDADTTITLSYDEFGRKIAMDDPDMGQWTYRYNGFGELIRQTDAKNQTVRMEYDILGRMNKRIEPEGISTWTYGKNNAPKGSIGKLLQENGSGLTKDYSYDNLGRPVSTTSTIAGQGSFTSETDYDSQGRVKRITYPGTQHFYTQNHYNANGFLQAVTGRRAHAESHNYSALRPLISKATTLADDYLERAKKLRSLGQYYQSQITFYQSLAGSGSIRSGLQQKLSQHQQQLSTSVTQGQRLSPEFLGHLNNTIDQLQALTRLINTQRQRHQATAEQLVVLAEQTLAAADHSFQFVTTLDKSADSYHDYAAQAGTGTITYWRAVDVDASGRISAEVYGNGIVNDYAYNQATGQLQSIHSSLLVIDAVRHLEYQYDAYQNLTLRDDLINDIRETYDYDRLDRLTTTQVTSDLYSHVTELNTTQRLNYNALGNITYKSDVGSYLYNGKPHAVTKAGSKHYSYDANGNMTGGDGRTIQWSSFNKPTRITQNGRSATFSYGPSRTRYKKVNHRGDTTLYVGNLYERLRKNNGDIDQKHYIYAAGQLVAEHILSSTKGTQTRYLHKDALGSIDLVTDAHANVVDRRSFDSWGKLRNLPWQNNASLDDPLYLTQLPFTNKGYTGHESVQEVNLIHMNGRLYDATLARFISADPHIQAGSLSQSYNRYSYVMNN